jgi:very-short-patch-repair endonuclease
LKPSVRNAVVLRARELPRRQTLPEVLLWRELRKRPGGFKFRRQHPLGWYVVDFYCPAANLVVEVDGQGHSMGARPERDMRRDRWIEKQDLRVVRFDATDVMNDPQSVVTAILLECRR